MGEPSTKICKLEVNDVSAGVNDRTIAACAISLVIEKARKGVVPLCTAFAKILQKKQKLEHELESLKHSHENLIALQNQNTSDATVCGQSFTFSDNQAADLLSSPLSLNSVMSTPTKMVDISVQVEQITPIDLDSESSPCATKWRDRYILACEKIKRLEAELKRKRSMNPYRPARSSARYGRSSSMTSDITDYTVETYYETELELRNQLRGLQVTAPCPLFGCRCITCEMLIKKERHRFGEKAEVFHIACNGDKPLLNINDRVMITGDRIASVRYIGHLDWSEIPSALYVGVELPYQCGDSDGWYQDKRYFVCDKDHGTFLPISQVLFVVERYGCKW